MPDSVFVLSILALLLTPGPTNTLLTVAGAARGFRSALPLLLGELAGYLLVVVPLATVAAGLLAGHPTVATAIRLVAAAWVLFLAIRLWIAVPHDAKTAMQDNPVTITKLFVTTLLNPKALIVGLVLMPRGSFLQVAPALITFSALVVLAGSSYLLIGSLIGRGRKAGAPRLVYRLAAACLVLFSLGLAGNASGIL